MLSWLLSLRKFQGFWELWARNHGWRPKTYENYILIIWMTKYISYKSQHHPYTHLSQHSFKMYKQEHSVHTTVNLIFFHSTMNREGYTSTPSFSSKFLFWYCISIPSYGQDIQSIFWMVADCSFLILQTTLLS